MLHAREYGHMTANPCVGKLTYKPAPVIRHGRATSTCSQREGFARCTCSRTIRATEDRLANVALRPTTNYLIYSCKLRGLEPDGRGLFGRRRTDIVQSPVEV